MRKAPWAALPQERFVCHDKNKMVTSECLARLTSWRYHKSDVVIRDEQRARARENR